jgi:hypothetical protein
MLPEIEVAGVAADSLTEQVCRLDLLVGAEEPVAQTRFSVLTWVAERRR